MCYSKRSRLIFMIMVLQLIALHTEWNGFVHASNTIVLNAKSPRWFIYLSEPLGGKTPGLSVIEHYSDLHVFVSRLHSWCDRRSTNESELIHNLPLTPCGKFVVSESMPVKMKSAWKIVVNKAFNVLLNFTRFSMDASVGQCRHSSLA